MKKILHFITGLESGGGAENMLLKTIPYIKDTENRVCAVYGRGEIGERLEQMGIKVYYLDVKNIFDVSIFGKYQKVINDFQPDVQINYLFHADIFGRIFAKFFGVKKVVSYIRNKYRNFLFIFMDRITLGFTDFLLTNSLVVLDYYKDKYNYNELKSKCIPNGVIVDGFLLEFDKQVLRNSLKIKNDDFVIVNIGSFCKQKDHQTLFKAIKVVKNKGIRNIKVFILGNGKKKRELMRLRETLGLVDEIVFLGIRDDKYRILSIADIFVLPSLHEGMSNALLEAMNSSLPCVVSDILENKELINDNVNGLVFKTGDVNDLAEKIGHLIKNKDKSVQMGVMAKKTVRERYNIVKIVEDLDSFLLKF